MAKLEDILKAVAAGRITPGEALKSLATREDDLGFAHIDTDRERRCGFPEVIYCPGKSPAQVTAITRSLIKAGQNVLATRATPEQYRAVRKTVRKAVYHPAARAITVDVTPPAPGIGLVAVVCAGTTDIPVGEEAALTAERLGARVERIFDVGVAGLHRMLRQLPALRQATAVIVVAGMEGALPSVVGGLIDKPLIAVPTSVGYGTSLNGLTALFAMLNSCVAGITVVNIDNGFGAGVAAARINRGTVAANPARRPIPRRRKAP